MKAIDVQIIFEVNAEGRPSALTLRQSGRDQRAPRVE